MNDAIPSREDCLALMEKLGMRENIVRHSLIVEQVAWRLAKVLLHAGEDLVLPEIAAGALLH
jgi:HD superfamily phosphodiesterase